MTRFNRIHCFVAVAIMMLAITVPSFAQISPHGYLSECDQNKALPDNLPQGSSWYFLQAAQNDANDSKSTPPSSLASYCVAEIHLERHEYQASVNAYRHSLAGDGNPVWTRVWSHIQMGKIFDITGQRERAVAQYQLAIQTDDNTEGAIDQAQELLEHPFEWPEKQ